MIFLILTAVRACSTGRHIRDGLAREPKRPIWERADAFQAIISFLPHRRPGSQTERHIRASPARELERSLVHMLFLRISAVRKNYPDGTPGTARRVNRTVPTELLLLIFSLRVSGRLRYDAGGASGRTRRTNRLCPFCSHFFRRPERLSHLAWAVHPGRPGAGTGAALAIVSLSSNAPFQPSACTARTARPDETGA